MEEWRMCTKHYDIMDQARIGLDFHVTYHNLCKVETKNASDCLNV